MKYTKTTEIKEIHSILFSTRDSLPFEKKVKWIHGQAIPLCLRFLPWPLLGSVLVEDEDVSGRFFHSFLALTNTTRITHTRFRTKLHCFCAEGAKNPDLWTKKWYFDTVFYVISDIPGSSETT